MPSSIASVNTGSEDSSDDEVETTNGSQNDSQNDDVQEMREKDVRDEEGFEDTAEYEYKADELKPHRCFQAHEYEQADALYSKAIIIDPTNPLLYTNRAMCRLKLSLYPSVLADCAQSISLLPTHMKAYYYRAQAHLYINNPTEALEAAKKAYDITYLSTDLKDIKSLPNIVSLVLKCKKVVWEVREKERLGRREALLQEVIGGIEREKERRIKDIGIEDEEKKRLRVTEVEIEFDTKIEDVRAIWEKAATAEEKKRVVPDWAIDNISFNLMVDPVMTKNGQSYERASMIEHLRRSATDPLTREALTLHDLRPNLGLKAACEEFLKENGWAVDW